MNRPCKRTREDLKRYFTPEQIQAIEKATDAMRKGFPWLEAEPKEVRKVAYRATFPRSTSGKRQDDLLLRVLAFTKRDGPLIDATLSEIARVAIGAADRLRSHSLVP